jgi:ribosomal protein S18 acetylase RimI-like enzyme
MENKNKDAAAIIRKNFHPHHSAELAKFASAHPVVSLTAEQCGKILSNLVSTSANVIDIWRESQRIFVGVVVDMVRNLSNSADFLILGALDSDLSGEPFELAIDAAEEAVAKGSRTSIEIPLEDRAAALEPTLMARGYHHSYSVYLMKRPIDRPVPNSKSALPPGFRWAPLSESFVSSYYNTLSAAFKKIPGAGIPDLKHFRASALEKADNHRLILRNDDVIAFANIRFEGENKKKGTVHMIGVHPDHQRKGLGRHVLKKAITMLEAQGAAEVELEVVAANKNALVLYLQHGFTVTHTTRVVGRTI